MTSPSAADPAAEGFFDGVRGGAAWGWAWFPDRPHQPARVEALIDGVVVGRGFADRPRADLAAAGKRHGLCAFEIPLPAGRRVAGSTVEVRVDQRMLPPGPHALPPDQAVEEAGGGGDYIEGFVDSIGPGGVRGWARRVSDPARPVRLMLVEAGVAVAGILANGWRQDLAEFRQGDGRGAFNVPLPEALFDGREHRIDLVAENGVSLLPEPASIHLPRRPSGGALQPAAAVPTPVPSGQPEVSFIVNFYNMRRQAERTLTSLTRRYQQGVAGRSYEVICVDNGSDPPLEDAFVAAFGPEFRLIRPAEPHPSPSRAINAAAREAKGAHLAVMIDGAHILTPGALCGALNAIAEDPDAVVALRHWFVGGDQRWLGLAGYDQAMEDILFDRIDWPNRPYELFRIGAPIGESPNSWFDGLNESNCPFLPAGLYHALGGLSEAFEEPGGGLVNLDLFKRAVDASPAGVTCLVGEASFHQFHGGATTNVSDEEKDRRVRGYNTAYRHIRGHALEPVEQDRITLRGVIRTPLAVSTRQRPLIPAGLGLSDHVRPKPLGESFDEGARDYLLSAYVESRAEKGYSRWNGQPIRLAPGDLLSIQEIIERVRPMRIVLHGGEPGLIGFLRSLLTIFDLDHTRIIWVSSHDGAAEPRVDRLPADAPLAATLDRIDDLIGAEDPVLALYEPLAGDPVPIEALSAYSALVSHGSYLVVLGSVFGQPWLGYSTSWRRKAISLLLGSDPALACDVSMEKHIITACPGGFLQRALPTRTFDYDAGLDDISTL